MFAHPVQLSSKGCSHSSLALENDRLAVADWVVMGLNVVLMVAIGFWSYSKVDRPEDFFAAGGKMPWWLLGISHHMSGYSGAVFVAYAGVAYTYGFTLYMLVGAANYTSGVCRLFLYRAALVAAAQPTRNGFPDGVSVVTLQRADAATACLERSSVEGLRCRGQVGFHRLNSASFC